MISAVTVVVVVVNVVVSATSSCSLAPAAAAYGDFSEGAAFGPVALAGPAEVPGLQLAVVVVVAELCVARVAARAL